MYIGKVFVKHDVAYFKTVDEEIYRFFWKGNPLYCIDDDLFKSFTDSDVISFSGIKIGHLFNALRRK